LRNKAIKKQGRKKGNYPAFCDYRIGGPGTVKKERLDKTALRLPKTRNDWIIRGKVNE